MTEMNDIQWFPGHMAKTRRQIKESLPLVDCVAEVLDARIPVSSKNPELFEICAAKPRIVLLNKCDLADDAVTADWLAFYKSTGDTALAIDCKSGAGLKLFIPAVRELLKDKIEKYTQKGMAGRSLRVMVAGIPNSGKSTFINQMAGGKHAKTENRPGVTRGRQWITIGGGVEMMDTPGVLWPKFEDARVGERLAFTGAVKDAVVDVELLASRLLELLCADYAQALLARYKLAEELPREGYEILCLVAKKRGMMVSRGEPDTLRAATMLLDEFRGGKLGRISLERP